MSFEDHYRICPYCNKGLKAKPTVTVKSASSCDKRKKLAALGAMIKGASSFGVNVESPMESRSKTKPGTLEKTYKLKELRKLISG
jgi:hypothetical protein